MVHAAHPLRVGRTTAFMLFVAPLVGSAALISLGAAHRPAYDKLVAEDGFFEWGTFAAFALIAPLALVVSRRLGSAHPRVAKVYLLVSVAALVSAGEEISWGQRLLGLQVESVQAANIQDEVNVHNIVGVYTAYTVVVLVGCLYVCAGSWLARSWPRARESAALALLVPPLFLTTAFAQLAVYRVIRFFEPALARSGEWFEFATAATVAVFVGLTARALGQKTGRASQRSITSIARTSSSRVSVTPEA